jgi:CRISPR/Cas system-associated protein Cas10 (large subunit of type III CRISPR-Cas system)
MRDLFAYKEAKRDFLLAWFAESHDNVVENLASKPHLTYHKAKERILNLTSNHRSLSGASSKNSKPQHEANAVSSSNGKKDKKKKKGSSSASISGGKECTWCRKHSPSTESGHIWTQCKELKAQSDRTGAKRRVQSRKSLTL